MKIRDVGCDDFNKAKENRERVAHKQNIEGYLVIENSVAHVPLNKEIDKRLKGRLPKVTKNLRIEKGDLKGFEVLLPTK